MKPIAVTAGRVELREAVPLGFTPRAVRDFRKPSAHVPAVPKHTKPFRADWVSGSEAGRVVLEDAPQQPYGLPDVSHFAQPFKKTFSRYPDVTDVDT